MGMQDRDYYREWWAEKEGFTERSPLRMNLGKPPANAVEPPSTPVKLPPTKSKQLYQTEWHPVLTLLATFSICLAVYGALKLFAVIAGR